MNNSDDLIVKLLGSWAGELNIWSSLIRILLALF